MTYALAAYAVVAAVLLVVGLALAPRPRSVGLIAIATLLWPIAMAVIAAHIYLIAPMRRRHAAAQARTGCATGTIQVRSSSSMV